MSQIFTVRDVARTTFNHDEMLATQIALQTILGRNAAFSDAGECLVDLGNGYVLRCTVEPKENC